MGFERLVVGSDSHQLFTLGSDPRVRETKTYGYHEDRLVTDLVRV